MKKVIIAIILLIVVVGMGIAEQIAIKRISDGLTQRLEALISAIDAENGEVEAMKEVSDFWEQKHRLLECAVAHNEIREIFIKLGEIEGFVACERYEDARSVSITLIEVTLYTKHLLEYKAEHVF